MMTKISVKPLTFDESNNKRAAVRYIKKDLTVRISKLGRLSSTKYRVVKLLDISSKGVTIITSKRLSVNLKVILHFLFDDNESFTIPSKIIHRIKKKEVNIYGLQFVKINNILGDHIVSTQNELKFK